MEFRLAKEKDIPRILELLSQVLEVHAQIRPDIFISGTTKYTSDELKELINNPNTPIVVALEEYIVGYAFCRINEVNNSNMYRTKTLFVDDLCVDEINRGQNIGKEIMDYVHLYAKQLECKTIILNVWEGNEGALNFYNKLGFKKRSYLMEMEVNDE